MRNSICVTVACLMLGATPHLEARTVQGDRHLAEGRAFEARKQYDAALASYREAMAQDPAEIVYQMAAAKCVFQAAEAHMALGRQARAEGLADKALAEFATAHALAPALSAAVQELAVTADMMRRNDRLTPLERVKKQQDDDRDRILPVPELQASTSGAITLTMVNQSPKVLFETIGKYAGMNVLFDPEHLPGKNLSLALGGITLTEALDHLALLSKSFWKVLEGHGRPHERCGGLAEMLLKHLDGIANYCETKVRFGVVEAVNGNIRMLINRGRGYKNLRYLLLKAKRMTVMNVEFITFRRIEKVEKVA